jgi:hypothetical protein
MASTFQHERSLHGERNNALRVEKFETLPVAPVPHAPGARSEPRRCGTCSECCGGALRLVVDGKPIDRGNPCQHRKTSGCGQYRKRPDVCRAFECGWLRVDSPLPDHFRPDKSGVILMFDKFRLGRWSVDLAAATDAGISDAALDWLCQFSYRHTRPLTYEISGTWYGFGPQEFRSALQNAIRRGKQLW